jgi:hypothetical protein
VAATAGSVAGVVSLARIAEGRQLRVDLTSCLTMMATGPV